MSYYQSYAHASKGERAARLSNYGFTCHCKACVNNWPEMMALRNDEPEYLISA